MTRHELEKAIKAGVKNFRVVKDGGIWRLGEILTLIYDDGSDSPLCSLIKGSRLALWTYIGNLGPIYPETELKIGDLVKSLLVDDTGKIIKVDHLTGEYLVLHNKQHKNMHSGDYDSICRCETCRDRCWWYKSKEIVLLKPAQKQEDVSEFKVGDRVETPHYGIGTLIQIDAFSFAVLHDVRHPSLHDGNGLIYGGKIPESERKERCWYYGEDDLKHSNVPAPKPSKELFFDVCYDKICVKLVVDGEFQAYAEAKVACPEDTFHLLTGAQIALQRLAENTGSKIIIPKSALSDRVELV